MPKLGVYFRADGAGHGNYICGVSPQAESDPDCGHWGDDGCFRVDESALDYPDEQLYEEVIWPTLAEYVIKWIPFDLWPLTGYFRFLYMV